MALFFVVEIGWALCVLCLVWHEPPDLRAQSIDFLAFRFPFARCWEFLIGASLAALWSSGGESGNSISRWLTTIPHRNRIITAAFIGVVLVTALTAIVSLGGSQPIRMVVTVLDLYAAFTPCFCLLILGLAAGPTFLAPVLEHPIMLLLGEASYSLYILHWVPLYVIVYARAIGYATPGWLAFSAILFTIAISIFCFERIETPARRWLRR